MNSFFERRYIIAGIFIALVVTLLARLFYLQIIDDRYLLYAQGNVLRRIYVNPARGPIMDRNHKILVENQPFYDIMVTPNQVKALDTVEFCKLLGIDKAEFDKRFDKAVKYSRTQQSVFDKQLSQEASAAFQERLSEFPGFNLSTRYLRTYPDSVAAQFLGYIGEVHDNDIKKSGGYYHPGDFIGVTGVERSYESVLRGRRGVQNLMYDSRNRPKGVYAGGAYDTAAVAGERLISSLDIRIQKLGEQLMKNKVGGIVAIEPSTGEILCYVSSPTYNPNLMVGHDRGNNAAELYKNPYKPFFIRPIQAYYPPGSSFKPLSALIALQEGIITPQTTYYCPGYYMAGNHRVPCYHNEAHGLVNLSSAVAQSCNGYFSMVFEKLMNQHGVKNIDTTFTNWRDKVTKFGMGARLGLDMPSEGKGNVPTAAHYDKVYKGPNWRSSTIVSLAIGQGELEATPLQMANIECTIANHGFYFKPHLVKAIGEKDVIKPEYKVKNYVGIDSTYFEPLINGMEAVVDHGTAVASKIPGIVMCGKTGTAQVHGEDNSVFVAYAPRDNPKIAIAVVVENSGEGAHWAAPIASFIVEKYLTDSISVRPSGITPEQFINANRLPDLGNYGIKQKSKPVPKDTLNKMGIDTSDKKGTLKTSSNRGKKPVKDQHVAAILKQDEDEQ
ncbi:MAG: penicillin-binding protein 2 [Sphingobacteriales bacterium]